MEVFKFAVLLLSLISSTITTADDCGTNDGMKYVVFNGGMCNNAGFHGKSCQLYSNSGVLEVIRESAGVYMIYFIQPYSNNNYAVLTSSNLQQTNGAFSSIAGNDDSLDSYYGVSEYFVRIETRQLAANIAIDSDYISVVAKPSAGLGSNVHSVVFDGEGCSGTAPAPCSIMSQHAVNEVQMIEAGLYKVTFNAPRAGTMYLVLASSNVWGTGGVIASIGGNTKDDTTYVAIRAGHFQVDTRYMSTNDRSPSDYVSVLAGTPNTDAGQKFVVFDGSDCVAGGTYGYKCNIYQQYGVKEVQREQYGIYKVWWTDDMQTQNYVVLCDSNVWGPGGTVCGVGGNNQGGDNHGVSVRYVEVQTRQMGNGGYANSDYISVLAFE